jgi:hypothetical protein
MESKLVWNSSFSVVVSNLPSKTKRNVKNGFKNDFSVFFLLCVCFDFYRSFDIAGRIKLSPVFFRYLIKEAKNLIQDCEWRITRKKQNQLFIEYYKRETKEHKINKDFWEQYL